MSLKKILTITAVVAAFAVCNVANAMDLAKEGKGFSVAVVDIPLVVQKSPQITALRTERQNKLTDLETFVTNARKDVAAQKTDDAKKALEDKYNKELNERKDAIDADFAKKLTSIDNDITTIIRIKAKKLGYDLTLVKGSVIDGGTDITNEIIKELK